PCPPPPRPPPPSSRRSRRGSRRQAPVGRTGGAKPFRGPPASRPASVSPDSQTLILPSFELGENDPARCLWRVSECLCRGQAGGNPHQLVGPPCVSVLCSFP